MDILEFVDLCADIGSISTANGAFQRHVLFDLRDTEIKDMTVDQLRSAISIANERFNRIHDFNCGYMSEISAYDASWVAGYNQWMKSDA